MVTWKPDTEPSVGSLHDLCTLWAPALSLQLGRVVDPVQVEVAMRSMGQPDAGLEPAVKRWRRAVPGLRFVPPGIRRDGVTELDIRMWLKVGAILERQG